jgi:hypothetical protein
MDNSNIEVREVDATLFQEFAGDAAFALVVKASGEQVLVVPTGTEYEPEHLPDHEISALYSVRASRCYEKCRRHKLYMCCDGMCVRVGDC